jgi:hypothetical protein
MLARLQEKLYPHPLRFLRVRFRRMSQQRESGVPAGMNMIARLQENLHPLRLLRLRFRRMSQQRETGDRAGMHMIARLLEKLHPLRLLRLRFRPTPQQRETGGPAGMNMIARLQEKLHPLRLLRVRFRRMSRRRESEPTDSVESRASSPLRQTKTSRDPGPFTTVASKQDPPTPPRVNGASTKMNSVASVQGKLHPQRGLRVRIQQMPRRENEATDSVNSRMSFPQAQRQIRNPTNTTRNLGPFVLPRLQRGLQVKQTMSRE